MTPLRPIACGIVSAPSPARCHAGENQRDHRQRRQRCQVGPRPFEVEFLLPIFEAAYEQYDAHHQIEVSIMPANIVSLGSVGSGLPVSMTEARSETSMVSMDNVRIKVS